MTDDRLPAGFQFFGINCGIKKNKKKDLGLFYSTRPCTASGVFTRNHVKAAPVIVSRNHIKSKRVQAIIVNSGCANACTGKRGLKDAEYMCHLVAMHLGMTSRQVLVASTGVIGQYLDIDKIANGIKKLCRDSQEDAVRAIMTTDTTPKISYQNFKLNGRQVRIWACAKGSGMIHPALATFLCFVFTDCCISRKMLDKVLFDVVDNSFNVMSVDGVTSTNDTVFALANGNAGNPAINSENRDFNKFYFAMNEVCQDLAKKIVSDGEGVTKFIEIRIDHARTKYEAKTVARSIATSPLVKTAIFGCDANWGRVITSIGSSGIKIDPAKVNIYFDDLCVCRNGQLVKFSEPRAKKILNNRAVRLVVNLHRGEESLKYYTCDMGYDYIKINASYRS